MNISLDRIYRILRILVHRFPEESDEEEIRLRRRRIVGLVALTSIDDVRRSIFYDGDFFIGFVRKPIKDLYPVNHVHPVG
jgi:hypothetical protein